MSPSPRTTVAALLVVTMLVLGGACNPIQDKPKAQSPLKPARMSTSSVAVDVFFVRVPPTESALVEDIFALTDNTMFSAATLQDLHCHGFRAGLLTTRIPPALARLLQMEDRTAPAGARTDVDLTKLQFEEPRVLRRHVQIPSGAAIPVVASGVYDRLPVLLGTAATLSGKTYEQAQCMLSLAATHNRDGRAHVLLLPSLHYGPPRLMVSGSQGVFRRETARERRVFERLAIEADLPPGHMMVVTRCPDQKGSLGHYFFTTQTKGNPEQKLLLVRITQTQYDELFDPLNAGPAPTSGVLAADEVPFEDVEPAAAGGDRHGRSNQTAWPPTSDDLAPAIR